MQTISTQKTYGPRDGITLELLSKFTKPNDPAYDHVLQVHQYRGDLTETGDQRLRASLGEEKYEHLHFDAVAFTGGILVVVPRWKFVNPDIKGRLHGDKCPGIGAEYWWAMDAISEITPEAMCGIRPCTPKEIANVVPSSQALLAELPQLEYIYIKKVGFYSTAKKGRQYRNAPSDVRFFRFSGGYGCVAIQVKTKKKSAHDS